MLHYFFFKVMLIHITLVGCFGLLLLLTHTSLFEFVDRSKLVKVFLHIVVLSTLFSAFFVVSECNC